MTLYYVNLENKEGKVESVCGPYPTKKDADMMVITYEAIYKDREYTGKVTEVDD